MAIAGLVIVVLGAALIVIGTVVSLKDWESKRRANVKAGVVTDQAGTLEGLAKLADALKGHPLGMQLIIVGIGLIILGGILGGVSGLK